MSRYSLPWPFRKGKASGLENDHQKQSTQLEDAGYLEEFGITEQLIDYVKGFTVNAFKDYPLQAVDDQMLEHFDGVSPTVGEDLTEWQERHATLVLSKVKELSQIRYYVCPRHLKERQFWRIYFLLVKNYVSPYEMLALTNAKLKMLELQNEKSMNKVVIELEMTDTKHASGSSLLQHDLEILVD